jgi:drug/metabolite transporter (DMT)-like permease
VDIFAAAKDRMVRIEELLRLIGSLILIAPALLATRQPVLPARGERLTLFLVGQLQVAGFLICSIIGLAILPAGRAIVLAYTMPLWAIPTARRGPAHRGGDRLCRPCSLHEPGPCRLG